MMGLSAGRAAWACDTSTAKSGQVSVCSGSRLGVDP
jgi:hypothetical protein